MASIYICLGILMFNNNNKNNSSQSTLIQIGQVIETQSTEKKKSILFMLMLSLSFFLSFVSCYVYRLVLAASVVVVAVIVGGTVTVAVP